MILAIAHTTAYAETLSDMFIEKADNIPAVEDVAFDGIEQGPRVLRLRALE